MFIERGLGAHTGPVTTFLDFVVHVPTISDCALTAVDASTAAAASDRIVTGMLKYNDERVAA